MKRSSCATRCHGSPLGVVRGGELLTPFIGHLKPTRPTKGKRPMKTAEYLTADSLPPTLDWEDEPTLPDAFAKLSPSDFARLWDEQPRAFARLMEVEI